MPRQRSQQYAAVSTPHKTPMKIPLNDDRQEKANRLQSRQALHEAQINQIKAAATPVRRRISSMHGIGGSPRTPANGEEGLSVGGNAVTPMKRVPILANFEEWMKMATDNKINATNSWNFALIDYFHDMSLLKEGDGVNFQRASCTLDGCVKIYTSRVDSVATETGKLLSGLADSKDKSRKGGDDGEGGDGEVDEEEEDENGNKKRKRRAQKTSEATLATSFAQLQLKKMELEFSVDPLFKKASADFDEGGAKGLLLNHLSIDNNGRIVFDSSDDAQDTSAGDKRADSLEPISEEEDNTRNQSLDVDISSLGAKYFPDLARLNEQDICPSLKNFDLGDANGSLDLPFLKAPDDWRQDNNKTNEPEGEGERSGVFLDGDNGLGLDDDDNGLGGFDMPPETGFGEGGEAWAKEAALDQQMRVHTVTMLNNDVDGEPGDEVGGFHDANPFGIAMSHGDNPENILNYFDQALQKNWAGPEHWKIKRIKDISKAAATPSTKRKEKEPFEIDFAAPMSQSLAEALYTEATSASLISLPKAQWKSKTRNLLPDDKHFNSRQLLRLFLKPKARLGSRKSVQSSHPNPSSRQPGAEDLPPGEIDEVYWARQEDAASQDSPNDPAAPANYDADFFQDDGLPMPGGGDLDADDDDFADAREAFSPPVEGADGDAGAPMGLNEALAETQDGGAFGAQIITQSRRVRPEYVQYARVAKKVDVRRLKEELWKSTGFEELPPSLLSQSPQPPKNTDQPLKFTSLMNSLQGVYPAPAMADISTSYCFICLLHLANEKGLVISNEANFTELSIRRDYTADLSIE